MKRTVVIGASIAGCLCAGALVDYVDEVVLVERDDGVLGPEQRNGAPQGWHVHGLWWTGLGAMEERFPGLAQTLVDGGAVIGPPCTPGLSPRMSPVRPARRWVISRR